MPERRVLVTGGGGGIGRAIVRCFAQLGNQVVAVGRDQTKLEGTVKSFEFRRRKVRYEICDVTEEEEVNSLFKRVGPVDVLVNNAGVSTSAPLERTTLKAWLSQIEVNATGAFLCTRAVLPSMRERNAGRIIYIASTAGVVGYPYTAGYTASKHAMIGLMRVVASELAGTGVTANSICPTFVRTKMTEDSIARIVKTTGRTKEEAEALLASSSSLNRLLDPWEVAAAVAFLAGEDAKAINGQVLLMDGGRIQI